VGPLLERWLAGLDAIPVVDQASVSLVRQEVRRRGPDAGLDNTAIERLAAAITSWPTRYAGTLACARSVAPACPDSR
jgi:hypothetical protein